MAAGSATGLRSFSDLFFFGKAVPVYSDAALQGSTMVAGMIMPLDNLKAIYEHLFRHGVMVAKKDKRPQTKHPEIPGVDNLHVIRAMGSLKSRGYVRETFTWRHYYWYLTNEGIVYLRDYLHLPAEIVPMPLQRVQRPAATLAIARRAERVQVVQGPTSYVPNPAGWVQKIKRLCLIDRSIVVKWRAWMRLK